MQTLEKSARTVNGLFTRGGSAGRRGPRRLDRRHAARALVEALEPRQLMAATHLAFDAQPTTTIAGSSISTITVGVLDGSNVLVTSSSALVTFSIATGPAGESLSFAVPAHNGVATLDGLSFITAGNYTLRASATGLTAAISSSFAITPDVADHLVITSGPSSTTAGSTISSISVAVKDQFDNTVTSDSSNVTIAIASGTGTLLGTTTIAASSGVAVFSDLSIRHAGSFTLSVTDSSLIGETSSSFTISPAAASKLVITQQPGNVTAGQTISTINVAVEDQYDNLVTNNTSSVTIAIGSGSGTLAGTKTVSASGGMASFSTLSLNQSGAFTLAVTDGSLTAATSSSFTVAAAAATHLVFTTQPSNITAGSLGAIAVSVEDDFGNVVTSDSSTVTLALASGSGSLGGTKTVAAVGGVATFSNLSITKADSYSIAATDASLTSATSSSFTVTRDAAAKLVITQGPTTTVAGQGISSVLVAVRDQYDNLVDDDASSVTIAIASGTGSLGGTATVAASGGVATFSNLSIQQAGGFTLAVTDGSLSSATSSSFTITPAAASQLVFTTQPGNIAAGNLGTVRVSVEDQYGNVVTSDSSTVTLAVHSGSGALLGTLSAAASGGVASFSGLGIHTAGTYTLDAGDASLTQGVSASFTVSPTTANHLAFTAQPSSMVAGNLLTGITAAVEDQYDNVVTSSSANITFRVTGGGGTSTFVVQASSGVSTLGGVYLVTAGSYSVRVTSSGLTLANSNTITVTPDVAYQVVIAQDTASTVAGHTLTTLIAQVQDQFGNLVTSDDSTVSVAITSGTGTLLGTTSVTASGGVAAFSDLSIRRADDFVLTLSDGGLVTADTASFTISPDAVAKLVITTQPGNTVAGVTMSNIVAKVEDQYDNVVTTDSSSVTIAIASGTGTLLGTTSVNASSGVATFSTLSIERTGSFTLSVTDSSLTADTSSSFAITPDAADHLAITSQPSSGQAGDLNTVTVAVQDQYNNVVTNDTSSVVIAIASGSGTLLGTKTVNASGGIATFSTLAIHSPDDFTLSVTDGSLTSATSSSFTITPADADHLTITQDTASATAGGTLSTILVAVRDQYDNLVTNNTSSVTIAITSGTGTLLGTTTVNASSGVATFSTLSIRRTGSFTLSVTDGSLDGDATASFTITPDAADHLHITQDTNSTVAGHTLSTIIVAEEDQYGNVVTTNTSDITIAPSSGLLNGTTTVTAINGVATFSDLSLNLTGEYTLTVTDGFRTSDTGDGFVISPDAASQIVITTDAANGIAGHTLSNIVAKVEDQYGNIVTNDTSSVTIAIASGTGTLLGTTTLNASSGVATFSTLSIRHADDFTLTISDGSLTSATTSSFTVSPDAANQLVLTQDTSSNTAGHTLSTILIAVEDQYGNVVTTDSGNVTLHVGTGSGTLGGTTTVAAISGITTFNDLSIVVSGSYVLVAHRGGLDDTQTGSFTISPDAADHLSITGQPLSTSAGTLGTITVAVRDQYENLVTNNTSSVTIDAASGAGSLLGTKTVNAVGGVATFTGLGLHVADDYTLSVTDGSLTAATSSSFTISAAAPAQLEITQDTANTVAGNTLSTILVSVEDQYGNLVTNNTSSVTIAIASGTGTLLGTTSVNASGGVVTFSTLSIRRTGSFTLSVTDGSLTADTTASFAITPDVADHLAITQDTNSTIAGHTLSTVIVAEEDQYGNIVTTNTSDITIAPSSGLLNGTTTVTAVNGVATFSDLSLNVAGDYTLTVTDGFRTSDTGDPFTISPDAASQIVITTDAASDIAGHTLSNIVAKVEDQYGNIVTNDTSSVTIAIATGTGTLLGTKTLTAVNGVATFSTLSIRQADDFTLAISDGSLTSATTASFTVSPDAASQLVITTQPANTVAGVTMSNVVAKVEDQYGNIITNDTSSVTIAIASGAGTLLGTTTVNASSGVATFSTLSIQRTGSFTFSVTDGSLTADTSSSFAITPDAADHLAITSQPSSGQAGDLNTVTVAVQDQYNNVVTNDTSSVVIAIASGSGTLLGTKTVNASGGIATFSTLAIHSPDTFTLSVTDGSLTSATSSSFTITPAAADHLTITQDTANAVAGNTLSTILVAVRDQYDNLVTNNTSSVTIAITSGTATLLGATTVSASGGIATFSTLSIQRTGSFTLSVSDSGIDGASTASFTITPDAADHLHITQDTNSTIAGHTLSTVIVAEEDQYGNIVTTNTSDITIAPSSSVLSGTTTVTAINGVATFSDLSLNIAGDYTLTVTDGFRTSDIGESFIISPDAASQIVITTDAANGTAGHTLSNIVAKVEDQYGNIVTNDTSSVVIAIASGTGTLLGTTTLNASSGVATFSTLSIQRTGSFTLSITDGSLTLATTSSFTISSDAASQLVITTQPASDTAGNTLASIVAKVEDQYGNIVTNNTSSVTIAISSGSGTLLGTTTVAASSGVATFSDLSLQNAGSFRLALTDGSLSSATSSSFTISPAAADHLTITSQPSSGQAGNLGTITVAVRDQYNNLITNDTSSVVIAITSGAGTLLGTTTVSASGGIATFAGLGIHLADTYTLSVTDGSLSSATSSSFTISAAAASQLVITQQPGNTVAGQTISDVIAKVEDQYGNVVTTDASDVTIAINGGNITLHGTTTVAAVNGVATFSGLSINTTGAYNLAVSDSGLTEDTTSNFTITPDAATHLVITSGPTTTVAGQTISSIIAEVQDQYGNIVTNDTSSVTIAIASGAGSLGGTTTVNASGGVATFSNLSITSAGGHTLAVTDGSLTSATSGSFTISPAAASQLVITQDASGAVAGNTLSSIIAAVKDQYGNTVTSNASTVSIAIASGTGTLLGNTTTSAVAGIATFSGLSIRRTGSFTLALTDGSLSSATTSSFTITPAAASQLVFTTQPANAVAGNALATVGVSVEDQYGNVVTTSSSNISLSINSNGVSLNLIVAASSGVASFSGIALTKTGSYTFKATGAGQPQAFSSSFTITPDVASQLVITQDAAGGAAGTLSTIIVAVEDQYGNVVTTDSSSVTLAKVSGPGALGGTATVAASSGIATFSAATLTTAGSYTLAVTDGSLDSATTSSFTITPAAASQLVITQDTSSAVAGNTLSTLQVSVEDQYGNIVTNNTSSVTIAIGSGTGTLLGTTTVAASSGVATFSTLSIRRSGSFTLAVTDGSLSSATSSSFTISPDVASQLVVTTQPTNTVAGSTISSIAVSVEDQYGNVVTTDSSSVTVALSNGGVTLGGTKTVAASSGVATFSGLSINTAGNYTLGITDGSLTSATSSGFTISPAAADHLTITTQPATGTVGSLSTITVQVRDQYDNLVTNNTSSVTIALASGSATLGGTKTVSASAGIATFSALNINTAGTYTLSVTDGSLTADTSSSFSLTAGAATQLVITQQPSNGTAGALSTIIVAVEDQYGNVVTTDSSSVTVALASGSATLGGTKTVTAASGVATFSSLSIHTSGSYTLAVTDDSLTSATSSSFTISPDVASQLVITGQPSNTSAGTLGTITVAVEDQYGNVVTNNTSSVTIAKASGPGTLGGTATVAASSGVATFTGLSLTTSGSYTLAVTDGSLTSATSSSFTVTAAAASQLVITQDTSSAVAGNTLSTLQVSVEDQYGNIVTNNTSSVSIAIASGTGTLLGTTTVNASSGVATFSTLSIRRSGSFTLAVTDGSLTSATSSSFTISPAAASQLVITQDATGAVAGNTLSTLQVSVEDQFGNVVTTDNSSVTVALSNGGVTLSGTKTVTASSGVATFSGLSINTAGTYTLGITDGSLTSATSSSFTVSPAAADHLAITSQPATGTVGGLSTITVQVRDQYDNLVTNNTSSVTIALASGSATLGGTKTVSASAGIATFSGLNINTSGSYTLAVTDSSLTSATSSSFTLAAGAATQLAITQDAANSTAGHTLSSIVVAVEDQYGNVVTTDSSTLTVAIASGTGTLLGNTTVSAVSGIATFSGLSIQRTGNFTLSLSDASLTGATTASFTITPDAASQLVFTASPANATAGSTLSTVTVAVEDQYGNIVTTDTSNITITLINDAVVFHGTTTQAAVNGVATFSDLSIDNAGSHTLRVSDLSLTPANSSSFTVAPAAASQLVITQDTASAVAGQTLSTLQVSIEDQYGNVVTSNSSTVTVAIASGTGTLLGTTTINASGGVASFSTLSIQKSGSFTLSVSDASLTTATTAGFTIAPDAVAKLVITQSPGNATAGTVLSTITVAIEDQYGNVVTNDTSTVSLALSADVSVNGTASAAAVSGVATFTGLSINRAGTYTFSASDSDLAGATTGSFTISPAAATKLLIAQSPSNTQVGDLDTLTVSVRDQYDNVVTTDSSAVTIAIVSGEGTLLGTTTLNASSGTATFSNLAIHTPGSFTLRASDGELTAATTGEFTLTAGPATHLAITQQPESSTAGTLGTITVAVEDQFNNIVTNNTSSITLAIASGTGTLGGTKTLAAENGVATFSALSITKSGSYTLSATDGELTQATTSSFTISPATATQLVITQQTESDTAGHTLSSIQVSIEDQYGNVVATDSSSVTIAIHTGSGTLAGTTTVSADSGVATFDDLSITAAGAFTFSLADGELTSATTDSLTIAPDDAAQLIITQDTSDATAGQTLSTITVEIRDQYGNLVTTDTSDVTIAIETGTGDLNGTATVTAVNGIATFSDLSINTADSYTLTVSDSALDAATTASFDITPAAPSKLVFTREPDSQAPRLLGALTIEVRDQYDNLVTTNGSNVTIAIATGPGTLAGTATVAAVNGVATFSGLTLSKIGTYTLRVSGGSLATDTTDSFVVGAKLVFQRQMLTTSAGMILGPFLNILVVDSSGRVISDDSAITLTVTGPGALNGTATVNAVNGVAAFHGLSLNTAGSYKLTAASDAFTSVVSNSFTVKPNVTTQLVILQDVANTTAGVKLASPVRIRLLDAYGNLAVNDKSKLTMSIASGPGGGALSGTTAVSASNGLVSFSNLVLKKSGTYTLQASVGELSVTTSSLTVAVGAPKKLVLSTLPGSVGINTELSPDLTVDVTDAYGNVVNSGVNITLALQSAPSGASLNRVSAASHGHATFSHVSFNRAGKYKLKATAGGLTTAVSAQFTVAALGVHK